MTILEYERKTQFPTRRNNARFRVDDDGSVYAQKNLSEPPPGREWTQDYAPEPVAHIKHAAKRIDKILRRYGFFDMDERYENPVATDGSIEVLRYRSGDTEKSVTVDRARVEAFQKLMRKLAIELSLGELL